MKYNFNKNMKRFFLGIFFLFFLFFVFPFKVYAGPWQGIDSNVDSNNGATWIISTANDESTYKKGESINTILVIYQCRKTNLDLCDGDSPDNIRGSGRQTGINFPISGFVVPGQDESKTDTKDVNIEENCGRIQADFVPSDESGNIGGRVFPFPNDCPEPTTAPAPSNSPTPSQTPTPSLILTPTTVPTRVPTSTPTGTPIPSSSPTPTAVPSATLTPTPNLDQGMCNCDTLEISPLFSGSKASLTAFGKVEGDNTKVAQISTMFFNWGVAPASNPNNVRRISGPIPKSAELVESTPSKARYKTTWEFVVPTPGPKDNIYRAWVDIEAEIDGKPVKGCTRKTAVLSASAANNSSFFSAISSAIANLIASLFGRSSNNNSVSSAVSPTPTPAQSGNKNLQLEPIYPAETSGDFCKVIYFQFKNPR